MISFLGVNSSRQPILHVIISQRREEAIVALRSPTAVHKASYHYPIYEPLFIEHRILPDVLDRRFSSYLSV